MLSLVLIFCSAACSTDSSAALTSATLARLSEGYGVCVAAVATLRNGAVDAVHTSQCESDQSMSEPVVFQAASLGKPVFAYGVLKLARERRLDLDAPLADYLPDGYVHVQDPFDPGQSDATDLLPASELRDLTARQVLTHTSGLPNWANGALTFEFPPGSAWRYSGEGYLLLQKAVESATGSDFNTFMRARVFEPLVMIDSSYVWDGRYESRFATGTSADGGKIGDPPYVSPISAATLYTTAGDYARFLVHLLGDQRTMRMISDSAVEAVPGAGFAWGLGWGLWQDENEQFIWHWGDNPGFKAFVIASLQTGDGVVILTNSDNGLALAESVVDTVMPNAMDVFRFHMLRNGLHRMVCRKFGWCF